MEASSNASLSAPPSSSSHSKVETSADSRKPKKMHFWRSQDLKGVVRLTRHFWNWLILNTWFPETVAMIMSVLCTAAIIAVLVVYQDKSIPQLPFGITLNATISILATASKTALLFVVGSTLSQLKWCWFQEDRRLQDMQTFDDASRGPWGSLILLWDVKRRSFASLGALITLLALAFDPFVQQVLRYPDRGAEVPLESGSVKSVQTFELQNHEPQLIGDIEVGIWSDPGALHMEPVYPSGECKWQEYTSFEWCTQCANATDLVSVKCNNTGNDTTSQTCYLAFDQGVNTTNTFYPVTNGPGEDYWYADFQSVWPVYMMEEDYSLSPSAAAYHAQTPWVGSNHPDTTYLGIRSPLLVMGHAFWGAVGQSTNVSKSQTTIYSAEQCVLTRCLKHYEISVLHGSPTVNVIAEEYGSMKQVSWSPDNGVCGNSVCWEANDVQLQYDDLVDTNGNYNNATAGIYCAHEMCLHHLDSVEWLAERLSGYDTQGGGGTDEPFTPGFWIRNSFVWQDDNEIVQALIARHSLGTLVDNVAQSLNRRARELSSEPVPGIVYKSEAFVRVRWLWLILPFFLHAAGFVLLLAAIASSRKHKARLWKDSLLPFLYHGLEKDDRSYPTDVLGMEEVAEEEIVSLDQSSADRIMLQSRRASYVAVNP